MNKIKVYVTVHLQWLTKIDKLKVVIHLMTYLTEYVFTNKTEDFNLSVFNYYYRNKLIKDFNKTYIMRVWMEA